MKVVKKTIEKKITLLLLRLRKIECHMLSCWSVICPKKFTIPISRFSCTLNGLTFCKVATYDKNSQLLSWRIIQKYDFFKIEQKRS